jgi:hypothetical protein
MHHTEEVSQHRSMLISAADYGQIYFNYASLAMLEVIMFQQNCLKGKQKARIL